MGKQENQRRGVLASAERKVSPQTRQGQEKLRCRAVVQSSHLASALCPGFQRWGAAAFPLLLPLGETRDQWSSGRGASMLWGWKDETGWQQSQPGEGETESRPVRVRSQRAVRGLHSEPFPGSAPHLVTSKFKQVLQYLHSLSFFFRYFVCLFMCSLSLSAHVTQTVAAQQKTIFLHTSQHLFNCEWT